MSDLEYWAIRGDATSTADVTLSWDGNSAVGASLSEWSELMLAVFNTTTSEWDRACSSCTSSATDIVPGGSASYGEVTAENVNFYLRVLTLASRNFNNNPLPVTLVSFTASVKENGIALDWATASEYNNDYFEVQRSEDGVTFETIGRVEGNGTSQIRHDYQLMDAEPLIGTNYYRLKQVDIDGAFEYSNVVSANFAQIAESMISVFPNPTQKAREINLEMKGFASQQEVNVQMIDLMGKVMNVMNFKTNKSGILKETIKLPIQLASGVYNLVIQDGEKSYTKRIVVQ